MTASPTASTGPGGEVQPAATDETYAAGPASRRRKWPATLACGALALELVALVTPQLFTSRSPVASDPTAVLLPPSTSHWFGTDASGTDLFSRIVYAVRTDLLIALVCVLVAMLVGAALGAFAGYAQNFLSESLMRVMDFLQAFPIFILALAFVSIRGQSSVNVMIVLSLLFVPVITRLVRAEALGASSKAYVRIAAQLGVSRARLMSRHVLPNSLGPAVVQMSVNAGLAVLLTADLGFIGAGVKPPTPEWGADVATGATLLLLGKWWASLFPSLAIIVTVWALSTVSLYLGKLFIRGYTPNGRRWRRAQ